MRKIYPAGGCALEKLLAPPETVPIVEVPQSVWPGIYVPIEAVPGIGAKAMIQ